MRYLDAHEYRLASLYLDAAVLHGKLGKCLRSRCGSVIVLHDEIIGIGYNSMPACDVMPEKCRKDSLPEDFKSDKTCCVHAEQRAIFDAFRRGNELKGSTIYFARLDDNGVLKPSGQPYCTICSKSCLDVGISEFVMSTKNGIVSYPMAEFNELSFQFKN